MKILNAFSINMLSQFPCDLHIEEIPLDEAQSVAADCESAVGHAETAAVFCEQLGCPVACIRATVSLDPGDAVLVGQYRGPRLPEGATSLPVGATIMWYRVTVRKLGKKFAETCGGQVGVLNGEHPDCCGNCRA